MRPLTPAAQAFLDMLETAGAGKYREWTAGLVTPIGIFTKIPCRSDFNAPDRGVLFVIYKLLTSSYK